jgi:hypothetical protein
MMTAVVPLGTALLLQFPAVAQLVLVAPVHVTAAIFIVLFSEPPR